jgi:molybdenum cofactor cytidylyltransferase
MVQPFMEAPTAGSLLRDLDLQPGDVASVIGAGGKTTTMLSLARGAGLAGWTAILATTTKIWPVPGVNFVPVAQSEDVVEATRTAVQRGRLVVLGEAIRDDGKVHGVQPEIVCSLVRASVADLVVVECDGAAGRPVKAHRPGEPVVPACSSHTLVVAGESTVHRLDDFLRLTGAVVNEPIRPEHVARALESAGRHAPPGSRRLYLLNKVDGKDDLIVARGIAHCLLASEPAARIVATSRGRAVADLSAPVADPARR